MARTGTQAPGTPTGVNFSTINSIPSLNSSGQIAFQARLGGGGVGSSNNLGIWATDRNGVLHLIARTGDKLEIAPGDFPTISNLDLIANTDNGDGGPSGFNNLGQLAFWASFNGSTSGVFVSNVVAIPEPSSLLLTALAAAGLLKSRRLRGQLSMNIWRSAQFS